LYFDFASHPENMPASAMNKSVSLLAAASLCLAANLNSAFGQEAKPLRALLITGGCCHDYAAQKDLLKKGLEARANLVVDVIFTNAPDNAGATKPPLPIYGHPDYAKGYDVVIHDECAADINDPAVIKGVLAPHQAGIPGVNLHCAIHCYRIGSPAQAAAAGSERALWFDYLGIQSSGHGSQLPITITYDPVVHPVIQGLKGWVTTNEELYNNVQIFPTATPLAHGKQTVMSRNGGSRDDDYVVVWVNDFHGTRVFNTTIGHNNSTVDDPRYLDLVTRGLLWACGKLDDKGDIAPGYGPKK
jgi:hypothetical protein